MNDKKLTNIRFGIEIEAEFPTKEDSWKLIKRNKIIQGWELDMDGSLNNGAEYKPKDKNKLYFNKETYTQIKEVIALIKVHKGHVRPTCGLHIHVDMSKFTNEEIKNIIEAFILKQFKIIKKFKVCKARLEETAEKIPKDTLKILNKENIEKVRNNKVFPEGDYFQNRHFLLNLQALEEHGTLEFRLFNGTIVPDKIRRYIKWSIKFCLDNAKTRKIK